ncbi:PHP domain-containing protein [Thiospirochaeta perfilievii]|uniref:PHP domain-containing protein n=1 Tax=Thiospirochaeta perfilievii TaxID=252967 RepID=A0A5C1QDK7_9SPIO|nr:PHP domain-containing protein [Thiospirochaeta perfilievii]QEN06165.1 PHP domain-containing protein [Thiospirochaeta perfilievii]
MIDLHSHTTCSDGSLTPKELIQKAKEIGLKAIAITDHDTLSGLKDGKEAAIESDITFIPGVELEITYPYKGEFHLLGLGLKKNDGALSRALDELQDYRIERNREMIHLLNKDGINISYNDLTSIAGGEIIARPHFSRFLVNNGYAKNQNEAFKKYLTPGCPYFVPKRSLELKDAINLIHESEGKAVIAHPQSLYISWSKLPEILKGYKSLGLDGIEAWHGGNSKKDCTKFEKIASDLKLIVSGGSDYHGLNIEDRVLGVGAGERSIPDIFLSNFI